MTIRFDKMHGLGNDFVVIDARDQAVAIDAATARALADRHVGIGCDQLITLHPGTNGADVTMRIHNPDGSEAGACGNATRAVACLIGTSVAIATAGGVVHATPDGMAARVTMGRARFEWDAIPLAYPLDTAALPVAWEGLTGGAAINVGNPHIVFFVDSLENVPITEIGPVIATDPLFPEGVNVGIAQVTGPHALRLRVWERGAGATQACGTGACAAAVLAIVQRRVTGPVTVTQAGGALRIDWSPGGEIVMHGPATHVFSGTIDLHALMR